MKKILSIIISTALLTGSFCITTFAETEIKGLNENLDELLMKNYFTEEELQEMDNAYMQSYSEYLLNDYIPLRQSVGKMETDSVEDEYNLLMEQGKIEIDKGLRMSVFSNGTYSNQYAKEGCFEYLFDVEKEYWRTPLIRNGNGNTRTCYKINGERFEDANEYPWIRSISLVSQYKIYNLIENRKIIKDLLSERGETEVKEIKICALALSRTGLYIKCLKQEYFLQISDSGIEPHKYLDEDYFEFTTLTEATQAYEDLWHDRQETYVTPVKSTYQTEAESLQERGLLKGNENGLDLLKPLTRIEAATMLLRAMGQSETTTHTTPAFSDVPLTHWGFGAAENAFSLGIINGIGNSLFAPDESVTAEQFATMVLRAGNHPEFNWEDAVDIMVNEGIISAENISTMDFFARCDMVKIIYEAIEKGLV